MTDPLGKNSHQPPQTNFSTPFPPDGTAIGGLNNGLIVPFNINNAGELLVTGTGGGGSATTTLAGGTTSVNLYQVGGSTFGLGQAVMASSLPVAIASNQTPIPVTGSFSISTADVNLISVSGSTIVLGQAVMGTSLPVAIASNQSAIPVTNAGGTATVTLAGGTASVTLSGGTSTVNLAQINGTTINIGQAVMTASFPVVLASNQSAIPVTNAGGTATVTLAGGTALVTLAGGTSDVNLTKINGTTINIGQGVMTASFPVVLASNQSAIPVTNAGGTATVTLAGGTAIVTLAGGTALVTLAGGTSDVNLTKINGTAINIGQAVMATSIPVAIASNQSNLPMNIVAINGTTINIGQAVMATSLPVAIASNQSAIPVTNAGGTATVTLAGGTATVTLGGGTTSVNLNQVGGSTLAFGQAVMATSIPVAIASNQSNLPMNVVQFNGATIATGGLSGLLAVGGATSSGSAVSGNPVLLAGRAQTGEIATAADATVIYLAADNVGKQIVMPYANKENWTAANLALNTTVAQTLLAAVNATTRWYVCGMQLSNLSASTTILVTFNDPVTSDFIVPAGGGSNVRFPIPLVMGLNSAVTATCSAAVGTCYINIQCYKGV